MAEIVVNDRKRLAVSDGRFVAPILGKLADSHGLLTATLQFLRRFKKFSCLCSKMNYASN
jgi:hypothetical protein